MGVHHTRFGCAAIAGNVVAGLDAFADILQRPMMPEEGLDAGKDLAVQSLSGIEDEPSRKLMVELRRLYLPWPYGRNSMGEIAEIEPLTLEGVRADFASRYRPDGAILAMAGNVDAAALLPIIEKLFGGWKSGVTKDVVLKKPAEFYKFFEQEAEQTYIGLAYPSVPETHEDYYAARVAAEVLGGGMSGRLFTEIREKRALCYSVGASYGSLKGMGSVFASAGTSNERAQATFDCLTSEIVRLGEGITAAELDRAKIGLKSGTIMSGEYTSARAGTIAHDFFMRGRLRGLDEIKSAIDSLTLDGVNAFLKRSEPEKWTTVVVGPKELKFAK